MTPNIDQAIQFIQERFAVAKKERAVVAVSGGIDSAVSLTLAVKALGPDAVIAVLLPYGEQNMQDAQAIAEFNGLPASNILSLPITEMVQTAAQTLNLDTIGELDSTEQLRLGNLMARSRMLLVFDLAKKFEALVCGTENRTEHYLGYFTRFGDEASDIEPISGWWKTEVRAAAAALQLPEVFVTKAPSAGLWQGQTDETELGFTYEAADKILAAWVSLSEQSSITMIDDAAVQTIATNAGVSAEETKQVLDRLTQTQFKRETPYRNELAAETTT
jgi:NAD+ synthase